MPRRIADRNIWVIYGAISLLGVAYGTSIAVLAVHLVAHGIPKLAMGGLAAAFALGIVAFSLPAGWLVQRVGARITLLTGLMGYAVCVGSFPLLTTILGLSVARFFDGAFSACVWVAAETVLLTRSDRANKGLVMSLYAISLAIGYVLGPLLAAAVVGVWGTGATFIAAGVLGGAAAGVVLVGLDKGPHEKQIDPHLVDASAPLKNDLVVVSARKVFWRTKTSCFATFSYGYFQASVVLFLPLYLIESKNVAPERTILITAFFAGGMLLMSTWAGRLGDRYGHLLVMRVLGSIGGVMVASFVLLPTFGLMCAAVFVAGATLASISPVSLALQGVVTPPAELGRANAFYNASYATGMLIGPPVSSLVFTSLGGGAMLMHLAGLWAAFVVTTLIFATDDPRHGTTRQAERAMAR